MRPAIFGRNVPPISAMGDPAHCSPGPRSAECISRQRTRPGRVVGRRSNFFRRQTMGLLAKPIKTLDDLFVHTLQDVYYAEQKITKALPKMIAKVTDPQLESAFVAHLAETENQITRLEQVFQMHGA